MNKIIKFLQSKCKHKEMKKFTFKSDDAFEVCQNCGYFGTITVVSGFSPELWEDCGFSSGIIIK